MTNEQKAARLEEIATHYIQIGMKDAALLRECAEMMRERGTVEWDTEGGATKNGLHMWAIPAVSGFYLEVIKGHKRLHASWHPTLESARLAAVAWVDEQEGK